nr:60S ribosomal protein L7 [Cryptomonas curvata]
MYYIKKIELEGFKSYQFKTSFLDLDKNLNVITGTNGSGKSNILDAVCFALGLSNLTIIRAFGLKDLIFKGKKNEKKIANVTLFLAYNNLNEKNFIEQKSEQIIISRKILNEGKTKYFLNNQKVHPSKILNFLFSINININNPNFLVRQGHITKIVQMNQYELLEFYKNTIGAKLYEIKKKIALDIIKKKKKKVEQINFILSKHINPKLCLITQSTCLLENFKKSYNKQMSLFNCTEKIASDFKFFLNQENNLKIIFLNKLTILSTIEQDFLRRLDKQILENFIFNRNFILKNNKLINRTNNQYKTILLHTKFSIFSALKYFSTYHINQKKKFYTNNATKQKIEQKIIKNIYEKIIQMNISRRKLNCEIKKNDMYFFLMKLLQSIILLKKLIKKIYSIDNCSENYYSFKEEIYKTKIKSLEKNKKYFILHQKLNNIFSNFNSNYNKNTKDIYSYIFDYFEPVKTQQKQLVWILRRHIYGILGSLIKLKNIFLIIAIDFSINTKLSFLIVTDYLNSKKILEELELKQKVTIVPLDKIIFFNVKCVVKLELVFFINHISFNIHIYNAVKFIFDSFLIISSLSCVKNIVSKYRQNLKLITLDGDIFDSSGLVITGSLKIDCFSIYGILVELNNDKIGLVRYGTVRFKQTWKETFKFSNINYWQKKIYSLNCKKLKIIKKIFFPSFIKRYQFEFINKYFFYAKIKKAKIENKLINEKLNRIEYSNLKHYNEIKNVKSIYLKKNGTCLNTFMNTSLIQNDEFLKLNYKAKSFKNDRNVKILKNYLVLRKKLILIKKNINQKIEIIYKESFDILFLKAFKSKHNKVQVNGTLLFNLNKKYSPEKNNNAKINFFIENKENNTHQISTFGKLTKEEKVILKKYIKNILTDYNNIKKKRAVIENDRLIIEEIIEKLEIKKKRVIEKSLKKINQIFQSIFANLLPGFSAKIVSIKSKDNFLKGLDFRMFMQRTKKKNISELSGGQTSLLALSFIFSLLIFKPSPFYILDEIDAALDFYHTQNVGKIIKNYFSISQFIVVTLKQGLILNSNVIFRIKLNEGYSTVFRYQK